MYNQFGIIQSSPIPQTSNWSGTFFCCLLRQTGSKIFVHQTGPRKNSECSNKIYYCIVSFSILLDQFSWFGSVCALSFTGEKQCYCQPPPPVLYTSSTIATTVSRRHHGRNYYILSINYWAFFILNKG